MVRFLIRDVGDVRRAIKVLAAVTVVMGVCMINEQITHQNIFGLLGGLSITPQIREGKLRSQGAFDVYIDAGEFGAVLVPLLVWLWSDKKSRVAALLGMTGATTMILCCNSSTPLLALAGWHHWALFLALPSADAHVSLGVGAYAGGATLGDERSSLGVDRSHRSHRFFVRLSPLLPRRQLHPAF